jgi:hypothetical protein
VDARCLYQFTYQRVLVVVFDAEMGFGFGDRQRFDCRWCQKNGGHVAPCVLFRGRALGSIDEGGARGLIAGLRRLLTVLVCLLVGSAPAKALVGGAAAADSAGVARHLVMIVGGRGNFCTGTVIARDLVLTAAHCVPPGADYKLIEFDSLRQPSFRDIALVVPHPQFELKAMLAHRVSADLALLKLATPLGPAYTPAPLMGERKPIAPGDKFLLAGYGVSVRGDGRSGGTARAATLIATGQPGSLQLRLVDPLTRGERPGIGACTGDSGAPVLQDIAGRLFLVGVVSWSTGPNNAAGCGGLTGVSPLARYRQWIVETAEKLRAELP